MFLPKRGFYHPVAILILAAITLSVAIILYLNSDFLFKPVDQNQDGQPTTSQSNP